MLEAPQSFHQTQLVNMLHRLLVQSLNIRLNNQLPHKVGKIGPKRPRTVVVRQFTLSFVNDTNSSVTQLQYAQILTMEDFEENRKEGNEQLLISHKLFSYIALKYVAHHCQDFKLYP